ncbi:helix-turn-helix domain-containing protein [Sphingobacterium daejeonense]|nr:helix-turn-helix domain-containing protein [Sphingobacterium daejeonense]
MSQIKQLIRLHREDYPIKTIARHLSISKNTVKSEWISEYFCILVS